MIWPFRPHPPLSLTHKVQLERQFRAAAAALGAFTNDIPTVVCPQHIDPVLEQVSEENLPATLFHFFAKRIPLRFKSADDAPTVEWMSVSLLNDDGQSQPFQKQLDDNGRVTKFQIDRSLKQFPYRMASIAALACAECWFRNQEEPHTEALKNVPFDVLPVFFGLTPILANAVLYTDDYSTAEMHQFEGSQMGSLTALEHGYLMALAEYCLGIDYSSVAPLLRPDAGKSMKAGLKFLLKTDDTIVPQDLRSNIRSLFEPPTAEDLASRNESVVLSSLIDLVERRQCSAEISPAVARLLGHSEPEIRKWAAAVLRNADTLNDSQIDDLFASLGDNSVPVRANAILALQPGFSRDEDVVDRLVDFLGRPERSIVEASVYKLMGYSDLPDRTASVLLKGIHTLAVKGAPDSVFPIAKSLLEKVCDDPDTLLQERFADDPTLAAMLFATEDELEEGFDDDESDED